MVLKLWLMESITLARTQPLVVQPVTSTVSTRFCASQPTRPVPKKADGWVLRMTYSPACGRQRVDDLARVAPFR